MFLEEGDVADMRRKSVRGPRSRRQHRRSARCTRASCPRTPRRRASIRTSCSRKSSSSRARSRRRSQERVAGGKLLEAAFGPAAQAVFAKTEARAHRRLRHQLPLPASVARYFIEQICRLPCCGRDRERIPLSQPGGAEEHVVRHVSQSGETADTLAALRMAKQAGYLSRSRSATCRRARWCANRNW